MAHSLPLTVLFLIGCGGFSSAHGQDTGADFKPLPEINSGQTPGSPGVQPVNPENPMPDSNPPSAKMNYAADPLRGFVKGRVINNGAAVYKLADFDSPVLGRIAAGKVFLIFPKVVRAFYRIQVGKVFGYVADSDIQIMNAPEPGKHNSPIKKINPSGDKNKEIHKEANKEATAKKKRILSQERTIGAEIISLNYAENVLGGRHSDTRTGFGMKLTGPDVALGAATSEINLDYFSGAPSYYSSGTGSADGFIFLADLQVMSVKDLNKFMASYFGIGPMLRFSHYLISNNVKGTFTNMSSVVDSMNLGLVISLGLGVRMGPVILRPEFRFQWEKQTYWSSGLTISTTF